MSWKDRLFVGSAALIIAASASWGLAAVADQPRIEPWLAEMKSEIAREMARLHHPVPDIRVGIPVFDPGAGRVPGPADGWAPGEGPIERPPPPVPVPVLPGADAVSARATLDEVTVAWRLVRREIPLGTHEVRKESPPRALVLERRAGEGEYREIAVLDPGRLSHVDGDVAPGIAYLYRLRVRGIDRDGEKTIEPGTETGARVPSHVRVKLIGGDAQVAIFRVETYDRRTRSWSAREAAARPGGEIGRSGWALRALRFRKSTLEADALDEGSVERTLTTNE